MRVARYAIFAVIGIGGPVVARELAPGPLTVGGGIAVVSDYQGSNDRVVVPAFGVLARVRGHAISLRGLAFSVDLVPEYRNQRFKIIFGPFVAARLDRAEVPRDPVVALLRRRKVAVEAGGFVGFTQTGVLTSPYETLTVRLSLLADPGTVHRSFLVTPTVEYLMPLSKRAIVGASASFDVIGGKFAHYYFGIGPRKSAISGLPVCRPSAGVSSATLGLLGGVAIKGTLDHGLVVGINAGYQRMLGDAAASPLVRLRGNPNQLSAAIGAVYTF